MKWPWQRTEELRTRDARAADQVERARCEFETNAEKRLRVTTVLDALRFHADQNRIVENIQRVARGH